MSKKARRKAKIASRNADIEALAAAKRATEAQAGQGANQPFQVEFVERPFAGMANEVELVAMRELLPAATLKTRTTAEFGDREVNFATVLPNQAQGMVRADDGAILVGLQVRTRSQNTAHDLAVVLAKLLESEPGTVVDGLDVRTPAPALADMIVADEGDFELHQDFAFWLAPDAERTPEVEDAIAQSRESLIPVEAIGDHRGVYWTSMNADFVRWVWPVSEDRIFDALARLRVADECTVGAGSYFIGAFRLHGIVAPVWQLPERTEAAALVAGVAAAKERIEAALADESPLSYEERRARAGLVSRQVSVR